MQRTFCVYPSDHPEQVIAQIKELTASWTKIEKPFNPLALQARCVSHEQRSAAWFEQRLRTLNGSEIGAVLGDNMYDKFGYDVLCRKIGIQPFFSEQAKIAVEHGKEYEPIAISMYERLFGTIVHEFGSIQHPENPSLAASPDGITEEGVLLEFKCPYSRVLKPEEGIPVYYLGQVCMNLETAERDVAHFIEYIPSADKPGSGKGKNQKDHDQLLITVYQRDPEWLSSKMPRLQAWLERVQFWKANFNADDDESINKCFAYDKEHEFRSPTKHRLTKDFKYKQSRMQEEGGAVAVGGEGCTEAEGGNKEVASVQLFARGLERFAYLESAGKELLHPTPSASHISSAPSAPPAHAPSFIPPPAPSAPFVTPAPPAPSSVRARGLDRYAFMIK